MTLWESIDVFLDFVIDRILPANTIFEEINLIYIIVGLYISTHIVGGLVAGWYGSILPSRIENRGKRKFRVNNSRDSFELGSYTKKKKRKNWWFKPSSIAIFLFSISLIVLSFLFEDFNQTLASRIAIMLVRSVLILAVWYYFMAPMLLKLLNKFLAKRKEEKASEIDDIIQLFPSIKSLVKVSWLESRSNKKIKRIIFFIDNVLINFLITEEFENGKEN